MASQADKDTAAAKAKQNNSNQAAIDTAAAKAKQNGGDGGTSQRMSQREAASGLNLADNDPMSGRGGSTPTMSEREEASGLNLAGNDPMSGRSALFYVFEREIPSEETVDHGVHDNTNDTLPSPVSSFSAIICVNGKPFSASIQGIIGNEIT
tara:strand:- start:197 stop:652 length:456 start_codon:yes stop_codon:yes gene_type:complete